MKTLGKISQFIGLILILAASNSAGQVPDLVVIKEGHLTANSKCEGLKTSRAIVSIPSDVPMAYAHTQFQMSGNGSKSYSHSYDSNSRTVTIVATADTHSECGCFAGICNEPGSNISLRYVVYAQKNACDPTPSLSNIDTASAVDYEAALVRLNKSKECNRLVLEAKKSALLQDFENTISNKASARYGEEKVRTAQEMAEAVLVKEKINLIKKEVLALQDPAAHLGKLVYDMSLAFDVGMDFAATLNSVSFQLEALKRWKKEEGESAAFLAKNPLLKSLIDHRKAAGLTVRSKLRPHIDSGFSVEKWMINLQSHLNHFNYYHAQLTERLRLTQQKGTFVYGNHDSLLRDIDVNKEVGLEEIESMLIQYKSKAEELYSRAVENQDALKRLHSLNKKSIDEWLCESEGVSCPISLPKVSVANNFVNWNTTESLSFVSSQTCLTLEFSADYNSDMIAVPRDNDNFASINGRPLYFKIDRSSIHYDRGKAVRSRSTSCFPSSLLKIRSNLIELKYRYGDGSPMSGNSSSILYANYGKVNQRTVCQEYRAGSTSGTRGCVGSMVMDLQDLDPGLKQRITDLQYETRKLEIEILNQNQQLKALNQQLSLFAKLDISKIGPEDLRAISSDLEEAAQLIEELRFKAAIEKEQVENEIANVFRRDGNHGIESILKKSYDLENDKILGPTILPDLGLIEATIESHMLGGSKERPTAEVKQAYDRTRDNINRELQKSLEASDFRQADQVIKNWNQGREEMFRRLNSRKAGAFELNLFHQMVIEVNENIEKHFDPNGFYIAAQIPVDVKAFVAKGAKTSQFANDLRIAMNKNIQDRLNAEQKVNQVNFYMMLRAYDELFTFTSNLDKANFAPQARKEVEKGLLAMAESGFRIGVSFTPVGKFVDFCELVTGRSFCKPAGEELTTADRALAGLGIFIGSGVVLRNLAKTSIIRESKVIAHFAEIFAEAAGKMKESFGHSAETIEAIGAKVIRIFGGHKSLTPAESRALTEKIQREFRRDYLNVVPIASDLENLRLHTLYKNADIAWLRNSTILKGTSREQKKYVRVYSSKLDNLERWWMTEESLLIGRSPEEIKKVLAIEYVPDRIVKVTVPPNTEILIGKIGKNKNGGMEGAVQYYLPKVWPEWFGKENVIGDTFRGLK